MTVTPLQCLLLWPSGIIAVPEDERQKRSYTSLSRSVLGEIMCWKWRELTGLISLRSTWLCSQGSFFPRKYKHIRTNVIQVPIERLQIMKVYVEMCFQILGFKNFEVFWRTADRFLDKLVISTHSIPSHCWVVFTEGLTQPSYWFNPQFRPCPLVLDNRNISLGVSRFHNAVSCHACSFWNRLYIGRCWGIGWELVILRPTECELYRLLV